VQPAIIGVLVSAKGADIVYELKDISELPIEWLSKIYDFEYVTKTRETFKVI
jgi:hypothetical protein